MATTPGTITPKLTAGMQRLSEAAEKAAAQAEGAKQEVRSAKALLKKARKSSKIAKKAAKDARKKVEAAAAKIKRIEAAPGSAGRVRRAKSEKTGPAGRAVKAAVAKAGAKPDPEAPREPVRKRQSSAAEAARSVIKRLKGSKRGHSEGSASTGSASSGRGEGSLRNVTASPAADKELGTNGATPTGSPAPAG